MKWYYAVAGTQVGPIDETELNRLVTQGTVRADTLVWHDGLASWQPLGVVRGMAPAAADRQVDRRLAVGEPAA